MPVMGHEEHTKPDRLSFATICFNADGIRAKYYVRRVRFCLFGVYLECILGKNGQRQTSSFSIKQISAV